MKLVVTANKLNVRKTPVIDFSKKSNIVGVILKDSIHESTQQHENILGVWHKIGDGWVSDKWVSEDTSVSTDDFQVGKKDWGFIDFKIDELWKFTKGQGIQVAILDSGLNFNLEDFKNNPNITYYNAYTDSEKIEDCLDDSEGHGTDCAGILCGQGNSIFGIAPAITLNVIKISDSSGIRTTEAILKGLEKAVKLNSNIISLSFRIAIDENFEKIHDVIKKAFNEGITVVAAVGDSGSKPKPADNFPASFPECISVGGINKAKKRSLASAKSNFLDIMAPGENLFSLTNPNTPISGSSFSTPFVTGVIALLKSFANNNHKSISNMELFDILKETADTNIPGYNKIEHGWGLINPIQALDFIKNK